MNKFDTTNSFITSHVKVSGYDAGDIIETEGYTTKGDRGAARWRALGTTGTASQDPLTNNNTEMSDASGNEFILVGEGVIDLNSLGGTSVAYQNIADNAGLVYSQGLTSDVSNDVKARLTVADVVADTGLVAGDIVSIADYVTGNNSGALIGEIEVAGAAEDGGSRIDLDSGLQWVQIFSHPISLKAWGAVGDYDTDDTTAVVNWLAYGESTNFSLHAPAGVYKIVDTSLDFYDRIKLTGDGAPIINTFPQTGGDKSLLRPGFKGGISGTSFIFNGTADGTYTTNRSDKYASFTYCVKYVESIGATLKGFGIIQDMDVLDAGGALTTSSTDNRSDYESGLVIGEGLSLFEDITVFGYFDTIGLAIHNQVGGPLDPDYNKFLACNINGGTAIIGHDTAAGASTEGLTGQLFTSTSLYAADHHTRADGDYTIPVLYIDGFLTGTAAGIRGHSFANCTFRTYANDSLILDHCDDVQFLGGVTEFSVLGGVTNADAAGGFDVTSNTKNVRVLAMGSTGNNKIQDLIDNATGKVQVVGAGSFDNAIFAEAGSGVRILTTSGGNPRVQLTDDLSSTVTGFVVAHDISGETLNIEKDAANTFTFHEDGVGLLALRFGATITITGGTGELTIGNLNYYAVATEFGASTDDLNTINGGTRDGQLLVLRASVSGNDVVLKDGPGNLRLAGGDFTLTHAQDRVGLMYDGANWVELFRSDNTV